MWHTEGSHRAIKLSAPNANNCEPFVSQSAAAGFLFPPIEVNAEEIFIIQAEALENCSRMQSLTEEFHCASVA
jgi:hypothetical protein